MSEGKTDVAILTAIPAELHAALSALGIPEGSRRKDEFGTVYHYGQIASRLGGHSLSVVVGCIGMAGNPSAAAAAAEFIRIKTATADHLRHGADVALRRLRLRQHDGPSPPGNRDSNPAGSGAPRHPSAPSIP
jgi:hypothetical protein